VALWTDGDIAWAIRKDSPKVKEALNKFLATNGKDSLNARGYQESRLDHNAKSRVGAIGVMQVMPVTGKELNVEDITQLEANIHAGVEFVRMMVDRYYAKEPMDDRNKVFFAFAAYKAGPGRVRVTYVLIQGEYMQRQAVKKER
jgi:membrane-bound lytic murein transglycosylase MltF